MRDATPVRSAWEQSCWRSVGDRGRYTRRVQGIGALEERLIGDEVVLQASNEHLGHQESHALPLGDHDVAIGDFSCRNCRGRVLVAHVSFSCPREVSGCRLRS